MFPLGSWKEREEQPNRHLLHCRGNQEETKAWKSSTELKSKA